MDKNEHDKIMGLADDIVKVKGGKKHRGDESIKPKTHESTLEQQ